MALIRGQPAREVDMPQTDVTRVFDAFFGNGSGSTNARSAATSPGWFVPISTTATSASSGMASSVSGTPTWLFRFPRVA